MALISWFIVFRIPLFALNLNLNFVIIYVLNFKSRRLWPLKSLFKVPIEKGSQNYQSNPRRLCTLFPILQNEPIIMGLQTIVNLNQPKENPELFYTYEKKMWPEFIKIKKWRVCEIIVDNQFPFNSLKFQLIFHMIDCQH